MREPAPAWVEVAPRWEDCPALGPGDAALVADVLRATTSMACAAAYGVAKILPVADLDRALRLKADHPDWVLAGERNNRPPPGFDRGNSPHDWSAEDRERIVVWTTSNGTAALEAAGAAGRVAAMALVNRNAAVRWAEASGARRVVLIAAGEHGREAPEDIWACGAVALAWPERVWAPSARAAVAAYRAVADRLEEALATTPHGRRLTDDGFLQDVRAAAGVDQVAVVLARQRAGSGWLGPWRPPE